MFGNNAMNCERAEAIVLDLEGDGAADSLERAAAIAHLSHCPRCAALQESWEAAKEELRALGEETSAARAPARVEMRLRQEFRTRHRTMVARRAAVLAAWTLAAAAIVVAAISSWNWQRDRQLEAAKQRMAASNGRDAGGATSRQQQPSANSSAGAATGDDSEDFTPLPGTTPDEAEEAAILHVRMQRGSLGALGLPVNEERAGEWIQVDLLVGNDGLPQAVRLAQEEN
jgi:predicted anti-sigma-YlaC factor YlaD